MIDKGGYMFLLYLYAFIVGSCIASFINVIVWRMPQEISFVIGRSYCPKCHKTLTWKELIPILSYICLKGKCNKCGNKIPLKDTLVEVAGGFIGVFCLYQYQFSWDTLLVFSIIMILLLITLMDFKTMTIPNEFLLALCIPVLIYSFVHPEISLLSRCIGFFIISLPMYGLICLIPDCFGGGDVKLMAVSGFFLGWKLTLLAFFIAIIMGGCYAIYLLLRKKSDKYSHIAFGPYICFGIVIAHIYGNAILHMYFSLFGL